MLPTFLLLFFFCLTIFTLISQCEKFEVFFKFSFSLIKSGIFYVNVTYVFPFLFIQTAITLEWVCHFTLGLMMSYKDCKSVIDQCWAFVIVFIYFLIMSSIRLNLSCVVLMDFSYQHIALYLFFILLSIFLPIQQNFLNLFSQSTLLFTQNLTQGFYRQTDKYICC